MVIRWLVVKQQHRLLPVALGGTSHYLHLRSHVRAANAIDISLRHAYYKWHADDQLVDACQHPPWLTDATA